MTARCLEPLWNFQILVRQVEVLVLKIPERIPLSTTDGTGTGDTTDALLRIKFNTRVNEEIRPRKGTHTDYALKRPRTSDTFIDQCGTSKVPYGTGDWQHR